MTIKLANNGGDVADMAFAAEIREKSRSNLARCYQCVACSAGCPVAAEMDYPPHQLIRMAQLGMKDKVLNSKTIWICLSCETCATRCPNGIEIVNFMDTLREIAYDQGRGKETHIPLFHDTFLNEVKKYGKVYELGMVLRYTIISGNILKLKAFIKDALLGANMFYRGKLAVLPAKIKRVPDMTRIYQKTQKKKQA